MSIKNNLSKLFLSAIIAGGLVTASSAYAFNLKISNHTPHKMRVWCTKGECNNIKDFKEITFSEPEHVVTVDNDFHVSFSLGTEAGQCNFTASQVPSHTTVGDGVFVVDFKECAQGIKYNGNNHQEITDPNGTIEVNIINNAKKVK